VLNITRVSEYNLRKCLEFLMGFTDYEIKYHYPLIAGIMNLASKNRRRTVSLTYNRIITIQHIPHLYPMINPKAI
jgi:hypothetical protein